MLPSVVQDEVYVDGIVSSAMSAEVMIVASVRVERVMVEVPITTMLLAVPVSVLTMPVEV